MDNVTGNQIEEIQVAFDDHGTVSDITFFFKGSEEPFSSREFEEGSLTYEMLNKIEDLIIFGRL